MSGDELAPERIAYGSALRSAIAAAGHSQKDFAERVPVAESSLSMVITGRRLPSADTADLFAERLGEHGVGLADLFAAATGRTVRHFDANGLPVELVALLRTMRQTMDDLPYVLRGRQRLSLSGLYVRQSVTTPIETMIRYRDDGHDELGLVEEIRRGSILAEPFEEVFARYDHLVIEGAAGLGKTTLGRHLVGECIDALLDSQPEQPLIPLLLPARVLAPRLGRTWGEAIRTAAASEYGALADGEVPAAVFRDAVAGARWLVVVDALDEIPDQDSREKLLAALAARVSTATGPMRFLVTTRPLSPGETARLHGPSVGFYELQPFDAEALERFAHRWFNQADNPVGALAANEFLAQVRMAGLTEILAVPLLASIAAFVYEADPSRPLPASRYDLYEQYVAKLTESRADQAGAALADVAAELGGPDTASWLLAHRTELLERMALAYTANETPLLDVARVFLVEHDRPVPPGQDWAMALAEWLSHTGLLGRQGTRLRFLHQTFAEHLAATAVARQLPAGFDPVDERFAELVRGLLVEDETAERVLVHYLHRRVPDPALLNHLQAGTRDQREAAGRLLRQGVPSTIAQLDAFVELAEQRILADAWDAELVATLSSLTRHAPARTRLAALVTNDNVRPPIRVALIDLLRESSTGVRAVAVDMLTSWTAERLDTGVRIKAASTLAKLGPNARAVAAEVLRRIAVSRLSYEWDRRDAAEALATLGTEARYHASAALLDVVSDRAMGAFTRQEAAVALARLGTQQRGEAGAVLAEIAADPSVDADDRQSAALALVTLGGEFRSRGGELLAALAESPDVAAAVLAFGALARIKPEHRAEAGERLLRLAADPVLDHGTADLVADALLELGGEYRTPGVDLLLAAACDPARYNFARIAAIDKVMRLGRRHRDRILAVLRNQAAEPMLDGYDRVQAAESMAALSPEGRAAAADAFADLFQDPRLNFDVRQRAAQGLARLGADQLSRVLVALDEIIGAMSARAVDRILATALSAILEPSRRSLATTLIGAIAGDTMTDATAVQAAARSLLDLTGELPGHLGALLGMAAFDASARTDDRHPIAIMLATLGGPHRAKGISAIQELLPDPAFESARYYMAAAWAEHDDRPMASASAWLRQLAADPLLPGDDRINAITLADRVDGRPARADLMTSLIAEPSLDSDDRIRMARYLAECAGHRDLAAKILHTTVISTNDLPSWRKSALTELLVLMPDRRRETIANLIAVAEEPATTPFERAELLAAIAAAAPEHRDTARVAVCAVIHDDTAVLTEQKDAVDLLGSLDKPAAVHAVTSWTDRLAQLSPSPELRLHLVGDLSQANHASRAAALPLLAELASQPEVATDARLAAARTLVQYGDPYRSTGIAVLAALAKGADIPAGCRGPAALEWAKFAPAAASESLGRLAEDTGVDPVHRVLAASELSLFGRAARERAVWLLHSILGDAGLDAWARHRSALILGELGPIVRAGMREPLSALSRDANDPLIRLFAEADLVGVDSERRYAAVERFLAAVRDTSAPAWDRLHLAHRLLLLCRREPDRVAAPLAELAADSAVRVWERRQAAEALAALRGCRGRAVGLLDAMLAEGDPWERAEVLAAVAEYDWDRRPDVAERLLAVAADPDVPLDQRRYTASNALRLTDESRARATALLRALAADPEQWLAAALALVEHTGERTAAIDLATDSDAPLLNRGLAAARLASTPNPDRSVHRYRRMAASALSTVAEDGDAPVADRRRAAAQLGRFGAEYHTPAVAVLESLAAQDDDLLARAELAAWRRFPRRSVAVELRTKYDIAGEESRRLDIAYALSKLDPTDRMYGVRLLRDLAVGAASAAIRLRAAECVTMVVGSRAVRATAVLLPDLRLDFYR